MSCTRRVCEAGKWAQCATCYAHKGRLHEMLHRSLGVPPSSKVTHYPWRTILIRIKKARIGTRVTHGKKSVLVTKLLKNRVIFALNMNPV